MKLSVMSARYGVPIIKLRRLARYGLEFDDDNLHADDNHKRACSDVARGRISPFVLAYVATAWHHDTCEWLAKEQAELARRIPEAKDQKAWAATKAAITIVGISRSSRRGRSTHAGQRPDRLDRRRSPDRKSVV